MYSERFRTQINLKALHNLSDFNSPPAELESSWQQMVLRENYNLGISQIEATETMQKVWYKIARQTLRQPWVHYEQHPVFDTPTLGAETEVLIESDIPKQIMYMYAQDSRHNYVSPGEIYADLASMTSSAGLPKSDDGIWEFAHQPVCHPQTLVQEIEVLYQLNLLEKGNPYPLHITLGGIPKDSKTHKLMCAILATGKNTSPPRISDNSLTGPYCKGIAGIESQIPALSVCNHPDPAVSDVATEMRLFILRDIEEFEQTAYELFLLGAARKAVGKENLSPTKLELQKLWNKFENSLDSFMHRNNVGSQIHTREYVINGRGIPSYRLHTPYKNSLAHAVERQTFCDDAQELVSKYADEIQATLSLSAL